MQINKFNNHQFINIMNNLFYFSQYYRQADGVPQFLPRFLQQGEWGKAFSQAQASSSEDDADSQKK
jgi:hypothetical protein